MALNVEHDRQSKRVKVTPGTTMFEVLESARMQFRLDESRQYQLLHRSKPVDLSIPFRLTGISNNASVELKELEGGSEVQQVRVCIQLRDGKRVQASFGSDASIEHILNFFKLLPSTEPFSLGFLRREIGFTDFATTTLKELGIVSGSAMLRVQSSDGQSPATTVSYHENSPQKPHVLFTSASSPPLSSGTETAQALSHASIHEVADEEMKAADDEGILSAMEEDNANGGPIKSSYDALQLLRDNNFDAVSRSAIVTMMKILTNVLSDPENEKVRSIRLSNAAFQRSVGQAKGGLEFLRSVGFVVNPDTQTLVLHSLSLSKSVLEEGLRLLNNEADDLKISADARPVVRAIVADPTFDVFQTQITRVQMQPRGPSTTEVLVDALKKKQDQLVGHDKPIRNTTVSVGGRMLGDRIESNGADGFDENAPSDAQLLISSLKAKRQEMEKAKNFRTQAMRELDELKRKRVFQTALIRIQFPDRAVVQAAFHPNETIRDVMDHVAECLDPLYKGNKFYLYVTPPTQKLAEEKTLAELNLVPAALTYLSWLEIPPPQSETTTSGFYFRGDLLTDGRAESKSSSDPVQNALYPKPLHLENPPESAEKPGSVVEPKRQASTQAKAAKKPSWLKL